MNNVFKVALSLVLSFAVLPELSAAGGGAPASYRRTGGHRLQHQERTDEDADVANIGKHFENMMVETRQQEFTQALLANNVSEACRILHHCKFHKDFLGVMLTSAIAENKEKFVSILLKEGAVVRFADLEMAQEKKDAADELFFTAVRWMEPVDVGTVLSWASIVEMLTNAQALSADAA